MLPDLDPSPATTSRALLCPSSPLEALILPAGPLQLLEDIYCSSLPQSAMSDYPSETGGRPLASSIPQPEGSPPSPSPQRKRRRTSQSSDERVGGTKSTSRRRPGSRKEASFGPHAGSSRGESSTMQRSTSPTQMSQETSVHYTRTGRISKAKKGLKVHHCECGRVCYYPLCASARVRFRPRSGWLNTKSPRLFYPYSSPAPPRAASNFSLLWRPEDC